MKQAKAQSKEGEMLSGLIEEIKRKTNLTQEQIAKKIGYKREYLSQAKMEGSDKLLQLLKTAFKSELENLTTSDTEKTQSSDMPADPERLEIAILNLSETDKINAKNIERLITLLEVKILGKSTLSLSSGDAVKDVTEKLSSKKEAAK